MTKRQDPHDKIKADGNRVVKKYGPTTGASKGSKPAPPATVKIRPGKSTSRVKWERKF